MAREVVIPYGTIYLAPQAPAQTSDIQIGLGSQAARKRRQHACALSPQRTGRMTDVEAVEGLHRAKPAARRIE